MFAQLTSQKPRSCSQSFFQHWSPLAVLLRTASAAVVLGEMFHLESLQVQKAGVCLSFVWYESGRAPLHPLPMPRPGSVQER